MNTETAVATAFVSHVHTGLKKTILKEFQSKGWGTK